MKYIIVFILLVFQLKGVAQTSRTDSEFTTYRLIKTTRENFRLYSNDCTDTTVSKLATKAFFEIISGNSKGENSKLEEDKWQCVFLNDSLIVVKLCDFLKTRIKPRNKLAFIIATTTDGEEFMVNVFIFTKKEFVDYRVRYTKFEYQIDDPSGEVDIKHGHSFKKNRNVFTLKVSHRSLQFL